MGVRGYGQTLAEAFSQGALALTNVITDSAKVAPRETIEIECEAPDDEFLFMDWLNALVYEMSTRRMLFSRFDVQLQDHRLRARVAGEKIDVDRHQPAVEVKGATLTALQVRKRDDGVWVAQCVVDV